MKQSIVFIITIMLISLVNWGVSSLFQISFLDGSFLTGVLTTLVLYFLGASDSPFSRAFDAEIQSDSATIVKTKKRYANKRGISFYAALVYLAGAAIITLIAYWDLFF